ncbi:hypothetical protein [Amycolatopsis sp. NPDC004169]|uniref:hypothetical protein n=1 Tax=Amycolatopsis sp. NPDC004169 TaxID=3154453 RepID=UPI0033B934CB
MLAVGVVGGVTGVLVALQRTGRDRPLPPAAEHLVAVLRSWGPGPQHLTGLALAGNLGPRFVDALVFTRYGVVVIAAHEPGPAEWPGPGDRTGAAVAAARGALAGHEGGRHVTGLVAVVPRVGDAGMGGQVRGGERPAGLPEVSQVASPLREATVFEGGGRRAEGSVAVPEAGDSPELGRAREAALPSGPVVVPEAGDSPELGRARGAELLSGPVVVPEAGDSPQLGRARGAELPSGPVVAPEASDPKPPGRAQETELPSGPIAVPEAGDSGVTGRAPASDLPSGAVRPRTAPPAVRWPDPHPVPGVAVVLADSRGLRRIIAQHNRWRTVWSADDVLDACYALSLAHLAPPRAALIAEGFPARLPVLDRLPELPAVVPLPPEPPPAPAEDEPVPWTPSARAVVFPRQRPIRQIPWALLFVLTLLVAAGVVAAVFVNQVFHGS